MPSATPAPGLALPMGAAVAADGVGTDISTSGQLCRSPFAAAQAGRWPPAALADLIHVKRQRLRPAKQGGSGFASTCRLMIAVNALDEYQGVAILR
jgi:hypothetical protein